MLRIVYNETEIVTIIDDSDSGTTHTIHNIGVFTKEEALTFFSGYGEDEINKIILFEE